MGRPKNRLEANYEPFILTIMHHNARKSARNIFINVMQKKKKAFSPYLLLTTKNYVRARKCIPRKFVFVMEIRFHIFTSNIRHSKINFLLMWEVKRTVTPSTSWEQLEASQSVKQLP